MCNMRVDMGYHVVDMVSLFCGDLSGCSGTRLGLIINPELLKP